MRLLAPILVAAALVPLAMAQQDALQAMEGGVYVAWGFDEPLPEDPPYGVHLLVRPGTTGCHQIGVWNTLSTPIRNVTLTLHPQRDAVRFGFEAFAGDDRDAPYAFWRAIHAGTARAACLHVHAGPDARTIDSLAVVRFELENGTEAVARWPKFGAVDAAGTRALPGAGLVGVGVALASAAVVAARRLR